jgi:hypothetical protein
MPGPKQFVIRDGDKFYVATAVKEYNKSDIKEADQAKEQKKQGCRELSDLFGQGSSGGGLEVKQLEQNRITSLMSTK